MNSKKWTLALIGILTFSLNAFLFSEDEEPIDELEHARENFEEVGEDLRLRLDELEEEVHYLNEVLKEAREIGEEEETERIESELIFQKGFMFTWSKLLKEHERLSSGSDEVFAEQHEVFYDTFRQEELKEESVRTGMHLREVELSIDEARLDGDEDEAKHLRHRAKALRLERMALEKLAEGWKQVVALRQEENFEGLEKKERHLGIMERDLDVSRQMRDLDAEQFEANRELEHLRRALTIAERRVSISLKVADQQRKVVKTWERIKKSFPELGEEQLQRMMEDFEFMEHEFHLYREMQELQIGMLEAEVDGDEEEVREIREDVEELNQEIRILKEERLHQREAEDGN